MASIDINSLAGAIRQAMFMCLQALDSRSETTSEILALALPDLPQK